MPSNIKINHTRNINCRLIFDKYYDFMLYKGETYAADKHIGDKAIVDFSDLNIESGKLYSDVIWDGAVNEGVELLNIGLTGTDNGFIHFDRSWLTSAQILDLMTGSTYTIEKDDLRFFMSPITGNSQTYDYPMFYHEEDDGEKYLSFKGGFYQGFYKLYGYDYQTLPNKIEDGMMVSLSIRPRSDYEVGETTVNQRHINNKGIFFYIGTRAENKFWYFYKTDSGLMETLKEVKDEDNFFIPCDGESGETYDPHRIEILTTDYAQDEEMPNPGGEEIIEDYFLDGYTTTDENLAAKISYKVYLSDYFGNDEYFNWSTGEETEGYMNPTVEVGTYTGDGLIEINAVTGETETIEKEMTESITSNTSGFSCSGRSVFDFNTYDFGGIICRCDGDCPTPTPEPVISECFECKEYYNKQKLRYFRDNYVDDAEYTCSGFTKAVETEYLLNDRQIDVNDYVTANGHLPYLKGYYEITTDNKFLIFDRTINGRTTKDWIEGSKVTLYGRKDWNNINLFPLMNRTLGGYNVNTIQYYYEKNIKSYNIYNDLTNNALCLQINEDGSIGYKYAIMNCENEGRYQLVEEKSVSGVVRYDEWNNIVIKFKIIGPSTKCNKERRKMRIYFYVNGYLKYVSKEIDEIVCRELNDEADKQEGVAYNISLGGGTQGLLEAIYPDYYNTPSYILPLERDFCGTFLGDIKNFKIYENDANYFTIKNYLC